MLRIKGVYDGTKVILLQPVSLPPNTAVDVLIPEAPSAGEQLYAVELQSVREALSLDPLTFVCADDAFNNAAAAEGLITVDPRQYSWQALPNGLHQFHDGGQHGIRVRPQRLFRADA